MKRTRTWVVNQKISAHDATIGTKLATLPLDPRDRCSRFNSGESCGMVLRISTVPLRVVSL